MNYFDKVRLARTTLTSPESVATLDHMREFFADGKNWTQSMYRNTAGARCIVGAANHVKVSSIDDAKYWLRQAIAEVAPGMRRIEDFNDGCNTYAEVAAVIARARQLALAAQAPVRAALPAPVQVVEIMPPDAQPVPVPVPPVIDMQAYEENLNRIQAATRPRRRTLSDWIME
jgi:hypothetical protein